ncbi:MAG: hypothetical protein N3A66_07890, partial [Planctomycetota bacterium]|nr:hypothetical protein [Planctomycetota bacterium]
YLTALRFPAILEDEKERRSMKRRNSGSQQPSRLNADRFVLLAVWCAIFAAPLAGGEDNQSAAGESGTTLYVLTVDDAIHEGIFRAFADGFLVLVQPEAQRELRLSPEVIEGVFRSRRDAEIAKSDPTWAQKCLGVEPVLDEKHVSAILSADDKTRSRIPPPGGSRLEEEFFRQPSPPVGDSEQAFQDCLKQAAEAAKDYRQQGIKVLGKRSAELAPMLSGLAEEPRLLLIPEMYRPLALNLALTKEILGVLQESLPRLGLRDKLRLLREIRAIREKWERFWQRHEAVLAASDLAASDKEQAKKRLQMLRASMRVDHLWRPPSTWEERRPGRKDGR